MSPAFADAISHDNALLSTFIPVVLPHAINFTWYQDPMHEQIPSRRHTFRKLQSVSRASCITPFSESSPAMVVNSGAIQSACTARASQVDAFDDWAVKSAIRCNIQYVLSPESASNCSFLRWVADYVPTRRTRVNGFSSRNWSVLQ